MNSLKDLIFTEALHYSSKNDWREQSYENYKIASDKRWIKSCCAHMPPSEWNPYIEKYVP